MLLPSASSLIFLVSWRKNPRRDTRTSNKKPFSHGSLHHYYGCNPMTGLKVSPEQAILMITERLDEIAAMSGKQCNPGYYDLIGWCSKTWSVVDEIFGGGTYHSDEIRLIGIPACSCSSPGAMRQQMEIYHSRLTDYIHEIQAGMTKEA
jgi:hypothetical protein